MPDDSRNNPNSQLALFVKPCHLKAHIVFLPGSSVIIAGVDHCIDTTGQADADYAFTNVLYLAGAFALDAAFLQVVIISTHRIFSATAMTLAHTMHPP